MTSDHNANDTNKAIERLTEQIAKLSINLAEKQAAPTPTPAYYLTKIKTDPNKELPMPPVTIVDKKNISSEIVMPDSKITKGTTKNTNPEAEVIITLQETASPMTDPDLETEADPGTEIIIITSLDMTDPEAEVNHVINTEMTEITDPLIDPDLGIALLLLTPMMCIQLILQMIILMSSLKLFLSMNLYVPFLLVT